MSEPRAERPALGELALRRPVEADYPLIVGVVNDWWSGQGGRGLLPRRLWFQHFTGRSWIAETADGRLAGFLVGFISPDHPDVGYIHMVSTDPNLRRRGVARAMYERFIADVRTAGAQEVRAVTWPGNRISVAFHTALGFAPDDGPGTQRLYGTPAVPDYDGDGEDRVLLSRRL
jgi:ribosomal protein S18 acetylase RimI-like enzyme